MNVEHERFQESRWGDMCVSMAAEATRRCGQSYDLYVQMFSELVDLKVGGLPADIRARAIARAERWDYLSAEGRAKVQQELADGGYCSHGLDRACCPVGCGDQ